MFTRRQALGLEPTDPKVATKTRKARVTKTLVKPTVHEVLVEAGLEDEEDEPTGFVINVHDSPVPSHASSDEDEPLALKAIRKVASPVPSHASSDENELLALAISVSTDEPLALSPSEKHRSLYARFQALFFI